MFLKPTRGDTEATGKGEDIGNEVAEQTDIIWLRSIQCRVFFKRNRNVLILGKVLRTKSERKKPVEKTCFETL